MMIKSIIWCSLGGILCSFSSFKNVREDVNKNSIVLDDSLQINSPEEYPFWGEYEPKHDIIIPQKWYDAEYTTIGWDWSLPPSVEVSDRSLLTVSRIWSLNSSNPTYKGLNFKMNPVCEIWIKWKEFQPKKDTYRWDLVKSKINKLKRSGYDVIFRPLFFGKKQGESDYSKGYTPDWVNKMNLPYFTPNKKGDNYSYYDPADPTMHQLYLNVIKSMGKAGIPDMVKAAYVGYASSSHGDEGIGPKGVDPDTCIHVRERLDAWANIFKGQEYKVYMGGESNYGISLGFGVRAGFVENYWYRLPQSYIGQYVDKDGYLCVNENVDLIKNNSFIGEENEEYGRVWFTSSSNYRFGKTSDSFPYRYFMSSLRLLQMRVNALVVNEHLLPNMLPFISLEMGRTIQDTPDIWSFLCEAYLGAFNFNQKKLSPPYKLELTKEERENGVAVKNMERWLYQRDIPGYETVPALKMNHSWNMWMMAKDKQFDYIARKGSKIAFFVDKRFKKKGNTVIKVTYLDDHKGDFILRYKNFKNEERTKSVTCKGDNVLKTTTWIVNDIDLSASSDNFDFTLESGNEEKITVSFVRLIRD